MANTMTMLFECNGKTLLAGLGQEFDITKVEGLESSDFEVSTTANALVDGSSVDGKRIKERSIHVEMTLKDDKNNSVNRQRIIKFFNPKYSGKLTVTNMGVSRNIEYELEGWTFAKQSSLNSRLSILVDLICPDPYFKNVDNFGKNMAAFTAMFAFPWRVLAQKKYDVPDPYKGMGLKGQTFGYRTLKQQVSLPNNGDVDTGMIIKFVATRGAVKNPSIKHVGTGKFIRIVCDMEKGDVLEINTNVRTQTIRLNGVNVYQKIDRKSELIQLEIGDNYIEYNADENYTNLDVNLYYTPAYLGV